MTYSQFHSLHWKTYQEKYQNFFDIFSVTEPKEDTLKESLQTASAVFSSNIEGNSLDLNSFSNAKLFGKKFPEKKEEQEIEDLIQAYQFAKTHQIDEKSFLECHAISSKGLLPNSQQGIYRNQKVGVFGAEGLVYMAVEEENVKKEMNMLFEEIKIFHRDKLQFVSSLTEIFFFASYIHLRFVHIHPFMDGNGRMARILEKWILAEFLGEKYWYLQTEEIYKNNRKNYYDSINIGVNFYELDYKKSFPFLDIIPTSL